MTIDIPAEALFIEPSFRFLLLGLSCIFHPQYEASRWEQISSGVPTKARYFCRFSIWLFSFLKLCLATTPFFYLDMFPGILLLQILDSVVFFLMSQWVLHRLSSQRPLQESSFRIASRESFKRDSGFCFIMAVAGIPFAIIQFIFGPSDHPISTMSMAMALYVSRNSVVGLPPEPNIVELQPAGSNENMLQRDTLGEGICCGRNYISI
ncbi:predicted protein [Coccidioides posadasii str. Silveira]|uniref:Predicted protein n=1 Tax=Coccidioides posadasii (strain RMSCC 757 / Silveira) TaxID=443226 RepID=E9DJW1_COCPS|nr:predicted protein [Coccidioides posadasii str. Silveira]